MPVSTARAQQASDGAALFRDTHRQEERPASAAYQRRNGQQQGDEATSNFLANLGAFYRCRPRVGPRSGLRARVLRSFLVGRQQRLCQPRHWREGSDWTMTRQHRVDASSA